MIQSQSSMTTIMWHYLKQRIKKVHFNYCGTSKGCYLCVTTIHVFYLLIKKSAEKKVCHINI